MDALGSGRLLVADDDPSMLGITRILLEENGYQCDTAASGDQVESCLRRQEYDLLIADIDMPGNRELQLVGSLPQLQNGLPVILVTGMPSVQSAAQSVGMSVVAYLIKPVQAQELLSHVRKAVALYRSFKAVVNSRQRMATACADLQHIETALRHPAENTATAAIRAFLDVSLGNTIQSLSEVRALLEMLSADVCSKEQEALLQTARPAVLIQALWETIAVLEKTKGSFKSKELGELRHRLEKLVGHGKPAVGAKAGS
jgi:DNA-binding response OmpR family regulator